MNRRAEASWLEANDAVVTESIYLGLLTASESLFA